MKTRQPLDYDVPTIHDRIAEIPYLLRAVVLLGVAFLFGYWMVS